MKKMLTKATLIKGTKLNWITWRKLENNKVEYLGSMPPVFVTVEKTLCTIRVVSGFISSFSIDCQKFITKLKKEIEEKLKC